MTSSTEVWEPLPCRVPELQSAGTATPAGIADLCRAEWVWDLFFQVAAEEAGSAPRGDERSNFPIRF